jgi:signal transduction histidine kinase
MESPLTPTQKPAALTTEALVLRLEQSRQQIATVQVLTSALAAALTIEDVVQTVLEHVSVFNTVAGVLCVRSGDFLELRTSFGVAPEEVRAWQRLAVSADTPLTTALRTGTPMVLAPHTLFPAHPGTLKPMVLVGGTCVVLPLRADAAALGVMGLCIRGEQAPGAGDIDYLMILGQQIALAIARAQLYERAREQAAFEQKLLAIVSHDLRTPLSAILLTSSMLLRTNPGMAVAVERIDRSARRMGELIHAVLDLAARRGETSAPLLCTAVDVDSLLADQCDELRAAFAGRTIELRGRVDQHVICDGVRLSQVVANLVRNALQHGLPDGVVTVTGNAQQSECIITVHNFGPEICAEDRDRLFDAFQRGHTARTSGVGLGLYIVHETTRSMGGSISVESSDGETAFTVRLPLQH